MFTTAARFSSIEFIHIMLNHNKSHLEVLCSVRVKSLENILNKYVEFGKLL